MWSTIIINIWHDFVFVQNTIANRDDVVFNQLLTKQRGSIDFSNIDINDSQLEEIIVSNFTKVAKNPQLLAKIIDTDDEQLNCDFIGDQIVQNVRQTIMITESNNMHELTDTSIAFLVVQKCNQLRSDKKLNNEHVSYCYIFSYLYETWNEYVGTWTYLNNAIDLFANNALVYLYQGVRYNQAADTYAAKHAEVLYSLNFILHCAHHV